LLAVSLVILIAAAFWEVSRNGFISYDDPDYLTMNPMVQKGMTSEGLAWAFGSINRERTYFHPLTWVSHMIDVQLFGMNPAAHHLVSLAIHAVNSTLLFYLLYLLTGARWRSWLVAALFGVHPLAVESVAWAAERKNVLSTMFWLLTMLAYVVYARRSSLRWYLASVLSFAAGLMCKPALVPLPCALLLLDYWPLARLRLHSNSGPGTEPGLPWSRILSEKTPYFLLAIASALITLAAHRNLGLLGNDFVPSTGLKYANILLSYCFYLLKTLVPVKLAVFYPFPTWIPTMQVLGAVALLLVISVVAVRQLRTRPYLAVGWFWFLGVFTPTIGFVSVGIQGAADRFAYVPLIGLLWMLVWGLADLLQRWRMPPTFQAGLAALALASRAQVSHAQVRHWHDHFALFERARTATQNNYLAYNTLAGMLMQEHRVDEAIDYYLTAQKMEVPEAGYAFFKHDPRLTVAHALMERGRVDEAIESYRIHLQAQPNSPEGCLGLGNALLVRGHSTEAIRYLRTAIRLDPKSAAAMSRLAWVLSTHPEAAIRNGAEALPLAEQACQLTGNKDVQALSALAAASAEMGNYERAVTTAELAARLANEHGQPALAKTTESLAEVFRRRQPFHESAP
jgi:tetratricopeptide (TPR) repeat protein